MSGAEADHLVAPGGLVVMVRKDPAAAARALAADLRAELALGGPAARAALDRLRIRQTQAADLQHLHDAMRRAEAVADRTRTAASERLAGRLNTTLAIHPDTIRAAAASLLAAEAELAAAEHRRRRHRSRQRGTRVGCTGAAGAAAAVLGAWPVALGLAVGAAVVCGTTLRRSGRDQDEALVACREALALARRRWEQVAGTSADPSDAESVIRRYDPQHDVVATLVAEHPAVRAADRVALERRLAWVAAWREELGDGPTAEATLEQVLRQPTTELLLPPVAPSDREEFETLVIVEPYEDLSEEAARQFHGRLLSLPRWQRVIVLLGPGSEVPEDEARRRRSGAQKPDPAVRVGQGR